jgi:hypothetical protein
MALDCSVEGKQFRLLPKLEQPIEIDRVGAAAG